MSYDSTGNKSSCVNSPKAGLINVSKRNRFLSENSGIRQKNMLSKFFGLCHPNSETYGWRLGAVQDVNSFPFRSVGLFEDFTK